MFSLALCKLDFQNEKGKLRFHNCLGISIITLIVTFQYIVVLFFGIKTHYGMKSIAASPSAKTRRLQTQLFKTLIFQVTVPTIFYNWPIFLLYLLPYANLKISFPSGVMIFFLNFYPAVDSLILMFLVGEYNITIRGEIKISYQSYQDSLSIYFRIHRITTTSFCFFYSKAM